ncbi:MAG: hypothetical protein JWP78_3940 [Mucilaginibacter sp.]|nr:hypothetical protein [Mucilaginibacter sp.]
MEFVTILDNVRHFETLKAFANLFENFLLKNICF